MFSRGLLVVAIAALSACGGGGGGEVVTPPTGSTNTAPVFGSAGEASVLEGSTVVITLSASDADTDSLTYSLDGADASLFTLAGQDVVFNQAPDFEVPGSSAQSNAYAITAKVSDGAVTVEQPIAVNVADAFEGRVIDGPVRDAKVYVQCSDGVTDNGDIETQSDAEGGYFLSKVCPEGFAAESLVSVGGVDTTTNKALTNLALRADISADPSKSSYITPISTLIASQATPALKQAVVDSLGLSDFSGSDSLSYEDVLALDPWDGAQSGDVLATEMQITNLLLGAIFQTTAGLVAGSSADQEATALLVSDLIASQITNLEDTSVLFTASGLTEALGAVLAGFEASGLDANFVAANYDGVVASASAVLATTVQQLADVADPTSDAVATVLAVMQTFIGDDISDAVDLIGEAVESGLTGAELDAVIAGAESDVADVVGAVNENIIVVVVVIDDGTGTDDGTGSETETEIIYEGFALPKSIKVLETVE